jgi:rhomboid protease GluP
MIVTMFQRRTTGSVVCPSCGSLVGVRDDKCYQCGRSNPGLWGYGPAIRKLGTDFGFATAVIGVCTIMYALTLIFSGRELQVIRGGFNILTPGQSALLLFGMSGTIPVFFLGWWWTVLTASWLHGSLLHIVFNMYWVRILVPETTELFGPARTVIIYTVAGACGFLLSSVGGLFPIPILGGAGYTVGASASILGLVGALVHYGGRSGSSLIRGEATRLAIMFIVMGFIMSGVDNYAHIGGFAGGYVASSLVNPLARERGDHMIAAAGCVIATLLALAYSVFNGLPLFLR